MPRATRPALDRAGSILCVASGVVDMSTGMLLSYETVDNHRPRSWTCVVVCRKSVNGGMLLARARRVVREHSL
ncbi:hypothetical protein PV343_16830 [Streptomyces sp. WI03-4A]|nr:hypothetical protein [Streptomyces sp. WI03-4A]MDX2593890.1 hypothetical protein [Streptomyces sp. WI03-4A]